MLSDIIRITKRPLLPKVFTYINLAIESQGDPHVIIAYHLFPSYCRVLNKHASMFINLLKKVPTFTALFHSLAKTKLSIVLLC